MSATDELRRLLDGRGVEHKDFEMPDRSMTLFTGGEHDGAYTEDINGTILVAYDLTPEQAVEATLGSDLEAENAKLRELLQRTWNAFHDATAREFVTVKNELRELGIEVDE